MSPLCDRKSDHTYTRSTVLELLGMMSRNKTVWLKAARARKETANESTRAFGPAAVTESKAGLLAPTMEDSDCPCRSGPRAFQVWTSAPVRADLGSVASPLRGGGRVSNGTRIEYTIWTSVVIYRIRRGTAVPKSTVYPNLPYTVVVQLYRNLPWYSCTGTVYY
eukprot:COSAG02_NODE_5480_length_4299_cov_2.231632_2_plen_164_part_00